jgi:type I restriction enzyme S subunit
MEYHEYNLDELGYLGRGKSTHRPRNDPALYGGDYPFVQTGDVKAANFYVRSFEQSYNEVGLSQSKLWDEGTLAITIAANIAETAVLDIKACFPDSVVGFIPNDKLVDVYFVKYYIDFIKREMQSISQGTTQDNLSLDKLRTFKFKVPKDRDVVTKISTTLLNYDNLIENNNRRIAILEDMAQSLYREWFVNFRYPNHQDKVDADGKPKRVDSPLGSIPVGWEVKKIKDLGTVITGKTPSTTKPEYYKSSDVPFLKTPDMHGSIFSVDVEDYLSDEGANSQKNKFIPANSVCVACIGAKAGVVTITSEKLQTNQQINSLVLDDLRMREYFYLFAVSLHQKIHALGSSGATMTNVNKSKFEGIEVLIPPESLLESFHSIISPCFDSILNLQKRNKNLKKQRDMLLPKLISGTIKL